MGYKIQTEAPHICLECGDEIVYGRTDKVYCSDSCRRKHNNRIHNSRKSVRLKVLGQLDRNYEILERLLAAGIESIDIDKLEDMGYNMKYATSDKRSQRIPLFRYQISMYSEPYYEARACVFRTYASAF